jgi:hypothetical protein
MQSDREIAEMIAKFRTPPGFNWRPLADDIETVLRVRGQSAEKSAQPHVTGSFGCSMH